ncbi:hypothetical protein C7Y70_13115 [Pseudoalteromonas sp. KS88]|uniref:hypothetical protein n=1 Tax=unclassified Pseudoalteromonas TaxID=194690 RepID=UPI001080D1E6|nr:hypothetical protein [Pseudoalteromonas sp. KS88]TGE81341.1 hypothetical protein C7Y70_13115 [Pseudoalteromonas sp. KS88]
MLITTVDDLIVATEPLSQTEKNKVQSFIDVLYAAVSLDALASIIDDVEVDGSSATYFVRVNEQHVCACIKVQLNANGGVNLDVTCYS